MYSTDRSRRILIVEDDADLARLSALHLSDQGYCVEVEGDGDRGCELATSSTFDLIIIDLMLPGMNGLDICRHIRSRSLYTPILILTARGDEVDRVLGLEIGADDYLTKPCSFRELVARVRAIFRRVDALEKHRNEDTADLHHGALTIRPESRTVLLAGESIDLTAKEFDLLVHFARHPDRVFSRRDLVEALWGPGYEGYEHTVNSHINRLRQKINRGGPRQRFIQTVWGVGYRFGSEVEP